MTAQNASDHFDKAYEKSGTCTVVLSKGDTGEGVTNEFRELIEPANVEVAQKISQDYKCIYTVNILQFINVTVYILYI